MFGKARGSRAKIGDLTKNRASFDSQSTLSLIVEGHSSVPFAHIETDRSLIDYDKMGFCRVLLNVSVLVEVVRGWAYERIPLDRVVEYRWNESIVSESVVAKNPRSLMKVLSTTAISSVCLNFFCI